MSCLFLDDITRSERPLRPHLSLLESLLLPPREAPSLASSSTENPSKLDRRLVPVAAMAMGLNEVVAIVWAPSPHTTLSVGLLRVLRNDRRSSEISSSFDSARDLRSPHVTVTASTWDWSLRTYHTHIAS